VRTLGERAQPHTHIHTFRAPKHTQNGSPAPAPAAPPAPSPASITFTVTKRVSFGQAVKLVGAHPALGAWDPATAPAATWGPGDVWTLEVEGCAGPAKLVVVGEGGDAAAAEWEAGPDRDLGHFQDDMLVALEWGVTMARHADSGAPSSPPSPPSPTPPAAPPIPSDWVGPPPVFLRANTHRSDRAGLGLAWDTSALPPAGPAAALVAGDAGAPSWLDKMRLVAAVVADGDLRAGGGPGPDPATPPGARRPTLDALANAYIYLTLIARGALPCVEAGGHARPNRAAEAGLKTFRSLEWAAGDAARCDDLTRAMALRLHARLPSFDGQFTQATPLTRVRDLAHRNDIAQALKAEIKHTIQNKLHRCAGPEDLVATEALLARLRASKGKGGKDDVPDSFLAEFETFTGELRSFFNAADLEASLAALGPSLDDAGAAAAARLLAVKAAADAVAGLDPVALAARAGEEVRVGGGGAGGGLTTSPLDAALNAAADALHAATSLRAVLARGLVSGLRTDAADTSLAMRQAWRIADARAEEYVFVTLSWALNLCEASGFGLAATGPAAAPSPLRGSPALARAPDDRWALPLGLVLLGVRNVGLSGWAPPAECLAVENELAAWAAGGGLGGRAGSRPAALRLRATLERALRLAGTVCDGLTSALADRADALGVALGVPDRTAGFAEAEVRASVAFQLAKAAAFAQRAARGAAALAGGGSGEPDSPWSALVPGEAVGTLVTADDLDDAPAAARALGGPAIVLARRASGDEEVGRAAGPGGALIAGILLLQDLPHLSHLGVRARQEGLPFAACAGLGVGGEGGGGGSGEDDGVDRALVGQRVRVSISADGTVLVVPAGAGATAAAAAAVATKAGAPAAAAALDVDMRPSAPVPLAAALPETCGPKAAACGALLRAASASGSLFTAPPGFVLPFGALPAAATAAGAGRDLSAALERVEAAVAAVMGGGGGGEGEQAAAALADLDAAAAAARDLVAALLPDPAALAAAVRSNLPPGTEAVAVRSSSAAEDLAGAAAAGLFCSVLGVPLPTAATTAAAAPTASACWDPLAAAIGEVWASLFSRRAVLARASAGVGQGGAAMAVLIQAQAPAALSFILHTADPAARAGVSPSSLLVAEVAVGAGEALASGGVAGSPWRLAVEKGGSGRASVRAFANLSSALLPAAASPGGAAGAAAPGAKSTLAWRPVDYSRHPVSCDGEALQALGAALGAAGVALEQAAGGVPQDVEGCFGPGALAALSGQGLGKGATLVPVIVQTRPQPGV